jgi:hypothetical protein
MNAKSIIFYDNVFLNGTRSATDTATDFDIENIIDWRAYKFWKAASAGTKYLAVDLNEITNAGFESGDYTEYTQNDAVIESVIVNSGAKSSKLVAAGSDVDGAETTAVSIDPLKTYRLKTKNNVTVRSAGNYKLLIHFYDAESNLISSAIANTWVAATSGFESVTKSVGPTGADIVIPGGAAFRTVQDIWDGTPTGTAYIDDIIFYEEKDPDALALIGHNLATSGATVSVESSADETEVISSWTERLAGFTVDNDKAKFREVTAVGAQRAWRLKIVTASIAPFVGVVVLGERLTMQRFIVNDFTPAIEAPKAETVRNEVGSHLGTTIQHTAIMINPQFTNITDTWFTETFLPAWNAHIGLFKPFVWVWDLTNHADEVYYVKVPDGFILEAPLTPVRRNLNLRLEALKE